MGRPDLGMPRTSEREPGDLQPSLCAPGFLPPLPVTAPLLSPCPTPTIPPTHQLRTKQAAPSSEGRWCVGLHRSHSEAWEGAVAQVSVLCHVGEPLWAASLQGDSVFSCV